MESAHAVPRRRKVGVLFLLIGLLSGLLATIAPTVSAEPLPTGTLGLFENEGDQDDATLNTGNIDWETVKTDPRITEWVLIHDDGDTDTNDFSWINSAKEQDPSTWGCAENEAPPKDDIFRLYLASQISQAAQFLHIGYVRASGTGDTDVNIEFNKVTGDFSCPGNTGRLRSRDDLMLSFTFGGGADSSVIDVFRWDPTLASDGPGDPAPGDPGQGGNDFVAADGHWDKVALAPNVAKGSDNAAFNGGNKPGDLPKITDQFFDDSVLEPRTFGELTLDLGGIFGAGLLGCPGTGFVNVHSRASHDFASDLKEVFPETQFDLSNCASIKIKKVDNSVPPVNQQGAIYGLYDSATTASNVANNVAPLDTEAAAKAAAVSWCSTGADGTCLLHDADPSKDYWIAEITPPSGLLGSTVVRAVDDSQLEPFTTLNLSDDPGEPFVNNVPVGNVTITKRLFNDANNNNVLDPGEQITPDQMSDLNGIKFELQQGGVTAKTHPADTNAECTITGGTGQCTISSVRLGTYQILETLNPSGPSGIGLGTSPSVTITTNGQTVTANYDNPLSPINIALDKLGDKDQANVGDTVNYTFTVTTTGVRLHNVTLAEWEGVLGPVTYADICDSGPTFDAALSTGEGDGFLDAGDAFIWKCPHLVTGSDPDPLPNRARAAGVDDVGRTAEAFDIFNVDILYPDLQVVKQAADGVDAGTSPSADETIDAPGTATYTVTVTNVGTGIARNATLTDDLPPGTWMVSLASPDGDDVCPVGGSPKSGSFTCTFGDLAAGASKVVTVFRSVTIANDCAADLENDAGVATTYLQVDIDPNSANDTSSATIHVRCPDVGVVKTASNSPISAGQRAEWTITLTNNGPGVAAGVFLVDSIPAGLTDPQVGGANGGSCSLVGNAVTCSFGDIAPNDGAPGGPDTRVITVSGLTDQADCATIPNTATVASSSQGAPYVDSNPNNNSSTASVVVQCPDLAIEKSTTTGTVSAGQNISFGITVTNNGPGIAFGVTLNDPLPTGSGVSWSENSAQCSITANVLSCAYGDLASGASASVTLTSATTEASCKTYNNTATADATNDDPVSSGASIVVQCPNLSIVKTADNPSTVSAGDDVGFTVTVSNSSAAGTGTAFGVTVNDPLPSGDGIDWSIQSQSGGASCVINGSPGSETLVCGPKDLAPGASFSVHIVSDTQPTGQVCQSATLPNTATADASNHALLTASASVSIQCPNVTITKVADDDSVSAGEQIGFTITVSNAGPGIARGVTLSDQMPPGVNWTLASSTAGAGCSLSAGDLLTCGPVDLASGGSFSAHVVAATTEADCALYSNTASADATNDDPVQASDDTRVKCPGLNIVKDADDPETVTAGDPVGFTITVSNEAGEGVGTATGVTLNDPLPAGDGVSWSVASQSGGAGCVVNGSAPSQTLVCGPVDLDPGESFSVHVTSDTDPTGAECVSGTLPNTATADATNHAPITASDTITIQCPDITITKVADADVVNAGGVIGFTITVSNAGPGIARDVVISDPLPAGAGVVWSVESPAEGCEILVGVLVCQVGDLGPSESFSVHVTATTPGGIGNQNLPAACKAYDNTATAVVANDADETASDSTEVICPLDITIVKDGPDLAHRGDEITYTFTVTNTGEADLVDVDLTDPICDTGTIELVDDADGDTTLAIGESWDYECTRVITATDPDPLPNTATAVGTDVRGRTTDDQDGHVVDLIAPVIQVVKTVDDETPDVGQTVTFTYVVTNTGDTTLFDVQVVDDQLGAIGTVPELAAGASATLTKTMVVAATSPTRNVATATGADVLGKKVTDDDDATITIVLGEVIVREPPADAPVQLPRTGVESQRLMLLSGLFLLLGGLLVASSEGWALRTLRRRQG